MREVSARELVPGDVVLLETGNVVPADGRLCGASNLRVQEAALTGESEPSRKTPRSCSPPTVPWLTAATWSILGHGRQLWPWRGGRHRPRACRPSSARSPSLLQSVEQEQTPLQQRLDRLGKALAAAALGLVVVVFVLGVLRGEDWREMLLTSVSLAVAAIPEALTAVVTIALSLGAQRMLKRRALIRQLPAVETLGSVSVICSDKTGTLTQNRMTVTVLDIANRHAWIGAASRRTAGCDLAGRIRTDVAADDSTCCSLRPRCAMTPCCSGRPATRRVSRPSAIRPKARWCWRPPRLVSSRTISTGPSRAWPSCHSTRSGSG